MKVTIGDLDYYYANDKVNCFNPDVMKISSFHKQSGDIINFVQKQDDIYRPFDLYYIIKENTNIPNPPLDFFTNSKVRWGGKAFKFRINGKMSDVMLACRPDYLLYPEKNTTLERAEHIRFLNNKGQLLPIKQDWHNSFTNKKIIVTDKYLGTADDNTVIKVLKELITIPNVSFFEPIWIPKILNNKEIQDLFLQLQLQPGALLIWIPIGPEQYGPASFLGQKCNEKGSHVKIAPLRIRMRIGEHGTDNTKALQDFQLLRTIIIDAKQYKTNIICLPLQHRLDTPYFFLFETIAHGTTKGLQYSGLEWITKEYGPGVNPQFNSDFGSHPNKWTEPFRDALRQTYTDIQFLTLQGGKRALSLNDLPGELGKETFKYGI